MVPTIVFIVSAAASFMFWKFVSGKTEGEHGRVRSLRFPIGKYTIWFHHWFYCSIAVVILYTTKTNYAFVYGFLAGAIVQGLTYKDFHYIFFETKKYPFRKL